jgi:2-polyprenyl-3-methyl-5-hydroxy-6-metoxy-1,4-benzoquinol methylase
MGGPARVAEPRVSFASVKLFEWLERAPFYEAVHADAVQRLGPGAGKTWLDVGCGPGLVADLAARRGYRATGIDRDPTMVRAAQRRCGDACQFLQGNLAELVALPPFDVVSAASLLVLVPDAALGLAQLWDKVAAGGSLLVVETSPAMAPDRVRELVPRIAGGRHLGLWLWARVRSGRAVDPAVFDTISASERARHALLHGLVDAWIFRKAKEGVHA